MGSRPRLLIDSRARPATVMDTGLKIRGRRIDLYLSDCRQAVRFGRQSVSHRSATVAITLKCGFVLRLKWPNLTQPER
jgi:hypothetical protein